MNNNLLRLVGLCFLTISLVNLEAQNVWVFNSIAPIGQTDSLTIPSTHRYQVLSQDFMNFPNGVSIKQVPDFTCYVPVFGSSAAGYLSLNHEITYPNGGNTIFETILNPITKLWEISNPVQVNFTNVNHTGRNCSGTLTPWGTVISAEEQVVTSDSNADGYYDCGWLVEINVKTKQVIRKLFKAGNMMHENCVIRSDNKTMYFGSEDGSGYMYKFVANTAKRLQTGKLYVLKLTTPGSSTGTWIQVPNSTPAQCNTVGAYAASVGATTFGPIEDVEIGKDSMIYFACKANGRIIRFNDMGTDITGHEIYIEPGTFPVTTPTGIQNVTWGNGTDNLCFDKQGNLWVCHDSHGASPMSLNYVWVIAPTHTAANPKMKLFASTPTGCEPTGITFTPDNKYMFMSLQFSNNTGNTYTVYDAAGLPYILNKGTTIVVSRKEHLGSL